MDLVKSIAPQTGHHRFDHTKRKCDRRGGVDGVAPGAQHIQPNLGRERMIGSDRAIAAHDQSTVCAVGEVHGEVVRSD